MNFSPPPNPTTERLVFHYNDVGRQRSKADVRELFELWWNERRGKTFKEFFKGELSIDMRDYYVKHYINEEGKSHAEYLEWKRAFDAERRAARTSKAKVEGSDIVSLVERRRAKR